MTGDDWLIWSHKHTAFWRPNFQGYTRFIENAGRYTREEAEGICQDARRAFPENEAGETLPHEIMMPAPEAYDRPPQEGSG